eukprot:s3318_g16.t1
MGAPMHAALDADGLFCAFSFMCFWWITFQISFSRQCDNSHPHLPWGFDLESQQFATALEAEYPKGLCEEYARTVVAMANDQGIQVNTHKHVDEKLHPQKQHGGRTVPPLIPEYLQVLTVLLDEEPPLDGKRCLRANVNNIPAGSKLLRSEAKGGGNNTAVCVFGIFHGHEQFVQIARSLWHPFDELRHLPDLMTRAIFELLSLSKLDTAKRRLDTFKLWRQWADELAAEENDGEHLRGPVHKDWHGSSSMKSTALDLKSTYKQLPLSGDDVNKAVVTVFDEEKGEPSFFLMHTLPFGASASVLHFNRVSNLLWAAGCKLGLVWASYFDDYPLLCPDGLEQSSVGAAKAMLGLFGFDYAGDKLQEPGFRSDLLGVELDLSLSGKGLVQVGNKKDRILELENDTAVNALKILKGRIASGKPKRLAARPASKPWLLFIDGALEYGEHGNAVASIGAILISPSRNTWYFGCEVPEDTLRTWQADGKEHVIGLVELYATVVALTEWKGLIKGR